MNKYRVELRETLEENADAYADSVEEALENVKAMYWNDEIELDWQQLTKTEIRAVTDDGVAITDWEEI